MPTLRRSAKRPDAMGLNTAPGLATTHLTGRAVGPEYIDSKKTERRAAFPFIARAERNPRRARIAYLNCFGVTWIRLHKRTNFVARAC